LPNARTHDAITIVTGLALAPLTYVAVLNQPQPPGVALINTALLTGAHLLSGMMFSPDLDIDSAIDNRWGIFHWIWRPYMWLVPHRHRWLSHGLVFSPLFRLAYFAAMVTLCFFAVAWVLEQLAIIVPDYPQQTLDYLLFLVDTQPQEVFMFLLGFVTGSAAHTIADWLVTGGKRFLRMLGIRITRDYSGHDRYRH
jgi:uncharacterized metal-binding protein